MGILTLLLRLLKRQSAAQIEQARYDLEQERLRVTYELLAQAQKTHRVEMERLKELALIHELLQDWSQEAYDHFGTDDRAEHLRRQIRAKKKTLYIYRDQESLYGPLDVPPHIVNAIEILETEIENLAREIKSLSTGANTKGQNT